MPDEPTVPEGEPQAPQTPEPTPTPDLGDTGKKALEAERDARKAAEKAAKTAQAELDKLRQASMSDTEKAVAQAKAEGRAEAFKDVNRKLLHAEVRAAAASVLADPDDAVYLLDLDQFDTEGDIDRKAIKAAVEQLAKSKPYLASQPGNGAGEGGARGVPHSPALNGDPLEADLRRKLGIT